MKWFRFGIWWASGTVTSLRRRKSPQGLSVPSGFVSRCNGEQKYGVSSGFNFSTIPSFIIWSHAAFPFMALGEPGSNGRGLHLNGVALFVFMACCTECLMFLKSGESSSGLSLMSLEYSAGMDWVSLEMSRALTEAAWKTCQGSVDVTDGVNGLQD